MKRLLAAVLLPLVLLTGCGPDGSGARKYVRNVSNDSNFGSGVVLAPGLVLTAEHVAKLEKLVTAKGGAPGFVLGIGDDQLDLALLRFPAAEAVCPCAKLAAYDAKDGETLYVIGYPGNVAQVVTVGAAQGVLPVTSPGSWGTPGEFLGRRLVMTASAMGGNSGGGVFVFRNGEYQLVGILTEGLAHITFAVPISDIRPFLQANLPFLKF